ncbi:MAG TPA: hypothetical protein VG758_14440 [Hyphomicrobiaceae bacterium]|nr:hypothetical protein [Hyphomicrobiaceae bacterium]
MDVSRTMSAPARAGDAHIVPELAITTDEEHAPTLAVVIDRPGVKGENLAPGDKLLLVPFGRPRTLRPGDLVVLKVGARPVLRRAVKGAFGRIGLARVLTGERRTRIVLRGPRANGEVLWRCVGTVRPFPRCVRCTEQPSLRARMPVRHLPS